MTKFLRVFVYTDDGYLRPSFAGLCVGTLSTCMFGMFGGMPSFLGGLVGVLLAYLPIRVFVDRFV